jgi:outer membrane lipoprotein SlyB
MIGTPNYPLLMASGLTVVIAALIGSAAVSGTLPKASSAGPVTAKTCRTCGVVSEIKKRALYDVTVRMDDGRLVTISQPQQPAMDLGDRVRVNGDVLVRG